MYLKCHKLCFLELYVNPGHVVYIFLMKKNTISCVNYES